MKLHVTAVERSAVGNENDLDNVKLNAPRTIHVVNFDGSQPINEKKKYEIKEA